MPFINQAELDVLKRNAEGYRFFKEQTDSLNRMLTAVVREIGPVRISHAGFEAVKTGWGVITHNSEATREYILTAVQR